MLKKLALMSVMLLSAGIIMGSEEKKKREEIFSLIQEDELRQYELSLSDSCTNSKIFSGLDNKDYCSLLMVGHRLCRDKIKELRNAGYSFSDKNTFDNWLQNKAASLVLFVDLMISSYYFSVVLGTKSDGKIVVQLYDDGANCFVLQLCDPVQLGLFDPKKAQQETVEDDIFCAVIPKEVRVPFYPFYNICSRIGDLLGTCCIEYNLQAESDDKEKNEFLKKMITPGSSDNFRPRGLVLYKLNNNYMFALILRCLDNNEYKLIVEYKGVDNRNNHVYDVRTVPANVLVNVEQNWEKSCLAEPNLSTFKSLCIDNQMPYKKSLQLLCKEVTCLYKETNITKRAIFFLNQRNRIYDKNLSWSKQNQFEEGEIVVGVSDYYIILQQPDSNNKEYVVANLSTIVRKSPQHIGKVIKQNENKEQKEEKSKCLLQ